VTEIESVIGWNGAVADDVDPSMLEPSPFHDAAEIVPRASRTVDGWTFVNGAAENLPAVWGEGDAILWAQGEPCMIVGPDGVGKTSLGQQAALARALIGQTTLLGLPIAPAAGKVLYLAADRPAQAARSMRRMITDDDEDLLRERLVVHRGPLPFDIVKEPVWTLRQFVEDHDASDLIVDSLKDLASELIKDEVGSAVNRAFQELAASSIELLALHHQRKQQQGAPPPKRIADVYGSRWLTAGMGSVVCLWGEPGDLVVSFRHLKQPIEEVGPFEVLHDHVRGRTAIHDHTDLEQLLTAAAAGLTCKDAARLVFSKDEPKANDVEKARRRLEALVGRNLAERRDDPDGLARYFAKAAA
jgi:replicative DNA helicase